MVHIGGYVSGVDVTDKEEQRRKHVEAKGEEMFQNVCETLPQLIWSAEPSGSVTWFSQSWYDYTGTTSSTSSGISWMDLGKHSCCFHRSVLS